MNVDFVSICETKNREFIKIKESDNAISFSYTQGYYTVLCTQPLYTNNQPLKRHTEANFDYFRYDNYYYFL